MNKTTNATDIPEYESDDSWWDWKTFLLAFYIIVMIVTILGNSLVCITIYVYRGLHSPTNWFIASLAVSDLLYASASLPFRILSNVTIIQDVWICKAWIWLDMAFAAASIANLAVISVDRHLKITKPFVYRRKMTNRRSFLAIGGVWLYAAILSTLAIIAWPGARGVRLSPHGLCSNVNKTFYTVAIIVAFLFPLIVLVTCYSMILRTIWIQFKKVQHMTANFSSKEDRLTRKSVRREFKVTKTIAIVLLTFTLCWAPFFIVFTIEQYDISIVRHIPQVLFNLIFLILPNLNSTLNPIIYGYFNTEFRRAFKEIVVSIWEKRARQHNSSLTSFSQATFARRGTPPSENGNHNRNEGPKEDRQSSLIEDTMITQI
ncbi:D(5)-like dopamine receptor [Montipora capricornis]|uniref:D(5)-like dopamine receptor n=1 Tax=Montipora capricornis TaxID=246305 RepID=UPI0035F13716